VQISLVPLLVLFLTAITILGIDLVGNKKKTWLPHLALGGVLISLAASIYLIDVDLPGNTIFGGTLALDSFWLFFQIFASVAAGVVIASSFVYMQDRTSNPVEYYGLLLIATLAIGLLAASTDLILIYVSFELLSVTSYILTGYLRDDPKSDEAAIKYFLYGAVASAVMLYGMSFLYGISGSTNLAIIASSLLGDHTSMNWVVLPALVFMMAGLGYKIGAVPFHQWSPDAYEGAPTPVSAFISVGPKAAGFAVLMRVLLIALPGFNTDWVALLSALSMMTMTLGNLVAISQKNIKRMLAYSSIAHAGYMLIGLISWNQWESASLFDGISGVLFYLLVYLFANLGAFGVVIAFEQATNSTQIEDYAGLIRRSPLLAGTMIVFLLSLIGIPGTGGFVGKLFVFGAGIRAGFYALVIVAILNNVIAAFYYLNIARYMFFQSPQESQDEIKLPPSLKVAIALACGLTVVLGLYAQPFVQFVKNSFGLLPSL
jgi:proton-translocating NADH-quinone oxidoreductase chain N